MTSIISEIEGYFAGPPPHLAAIVSPEGFQFVVGKTPFTSPVFLGLSVVAYITTAFAIRAVMASREPFKLTSVVVLHNAVLCLGSGAMLLGILHEIAKSSKNIYPAAAGHSPLALWCDPDSRMFPETKLSFWIYIYYLSKFYEMGDTFILALKKKPLTFLQMYHHAVIGPLTWAWLAGGFTMAWWGVAANTLVHVFMYYYFARSALGHTVWWKRYMTAGQLVQFSSAFFLISYWLFTVQGLAFSLAPPFYTATDTGCAGEVWVVMTSQAVNISFLYLFGSFFFNAKNYNKKKQAGEGKKSK